MEVNLARRFFPGSVLALKAAWGPAGVGAAINP